MSNKVSRRLTKKDIFTIPNLLSLFRLLLIPVIVYVYLSLKKPFIAFILLVVSGISDILDGIIARKFDMVSDFGKFLDPLADKLTQFAVIVCLMFAFKWLIFVVALIAVREVSMLTLGSIVLKKTDTVNSAKWYGKLSTVVIYATISILLVFPSISKELQVVLFALGVCVIALSFIGYMVFYTKLLINKKHVQNNN